MNVSAYPSDSAYREFIDKNGNYLDPKGYEFDRWTGDTQYITTGSATTPTISVTIPDGGITLVSLRATYKPRTFTLTIVNGFIDETGKPTSMTLGYNQRVYIDANAAPTGKVFHQWTGDAAHVANTQVAYSTFTMPAKDAIVTATYRDPLYNLTVINGTGSGEYLAGQRVPIAANDAGAFLRWIRDVDGGNVENIFEPSTFVIMPEIDILIEAEDKPKMGFDDHKRLSAVVYPNPSSGTVYIVLSENCESIVLTNLLGNAVMELGKQESGTVQLDLSSLSAGMYTLTIKGKENTYQAKLLLR